MADFRNRHGSFMVRTAESAYRKLEEFEQERAAIRKRVGTDPTLKPEHKPRLIDRAVSEARQVALKAPRDAVEAMRKRIASDVEEAAKAVSKGMEPQLVPENAREIRAYVRGLAPEERIGFLRDRAAAGDCETIYAVYDVAQQGYLSGLDELNEPVREALRQEVTRTLAPTESARLEAAQRVAQHVERMAAALEQVT